MFSAWIETYETIKKYIFLPSKTFSVLRAATTPISSWANLVADPKCYTRIKKANI